MPRRSKYNLDAIRAASNLDCPHCHADLNAAEYLRVDSERVRCVKCGADFVPETKSGPRGQASPLRSEREYQRNKPANDTPTRQKINQENGLRLRVLFLPADD